MKKLLVLTLTCLATVSAFAADGATLFKEKNCIECHGEDGSKAIPEKGVKPLNVPATTGKSIEQLSGIISKGSKGKLTDEECKALANFIKSLK